MTECCAAVVAQEVAWWKGQGRPMAETVTLFCRGCGSGLYRKNNQWRRTRDDEPPPQASGLMAFVEGT